MRSQLPTEMARRIAGGENWLEIWLEMRGITVTQLATLADINVGDLGRIAEGRLEPNAGQISKIAHALNVDVKELEKTMRLGIPKH